MLKKIVIGSIAVVVLAVLVLGVRPVVGYLLGARKTAQKFVAENTPTDKGKERFI